MQRGFVPACGRLALLCGLGLAVLASAGRTEGLQTLSGPEALAVALGSAGPGSVLLLAGGEYGALALRGLSGAPEAPVTLRAADPADPPRFATMEVREARHVVLDGLIFDYVFQPGDESFLRPFQILGSTDVTITGALFDGDRARGVSAVDDGFGTGFGLGVRGSSQILVQDSEIRDFFRGLVVSESADITVRGNDVHTIRMDGMNFSQVETVLIENNTIRDFNRSLDSADHADMIQFWTNGTTAASRDIVIRNNVLNSGAGWYTQSIFMRNDLVDRGLAGPEMFYRDVLIEGNVIINAHLHGITVGETAGLTIRHNSVIRNAASEGKDDNPGLWTPQIRVSPASTGVQIHGNVVSAIGGYGGQADWVMSDNLLIQDRDPQRPGYYDQVFVAARSGNPRDLASFAYLAGGPLDGSGIGAPRLAALERSDSLNPVIRVLPDPSHLNRFSFDAGTSGGALGADPVFAWDFGDGTTATGPVVTHDFAGSGPRQVSLSVTTTAGVSASRTVEVVVPGPDVVTFSAEKGEFTAWAAGIPSLIPDTPVAIGPAVLGQGQRVIDTGREALAPFFDARDFDLRLRIRAAGKDPAGELLRIHTTLLINVTDRGGLDVRFDTVSADQLRLQTGPLRLLAGQWHDIRLVYSAVSGEVVLEVDGKVAATGRTSGVIKPLQHWGLALGNPFDNRKSFDGELESLHLQANVAGFAPVQ